MQGMGRSVAGTRYKDGELGRAARDAGGGELLRRVHAMQGIGDSAAGCARGGGVLEVAGAHGGARPLRSERARETGRG